jgi:hypothetical protein
MIKTVTVVEESGTKLVILLDQIESLSWWPNSEHSAMVFMKSGHHFEIPQEVAEELEQAWLAYLGDYHTQPLTH